MERGPIAAEADVSAIFEQLRAEVRKSSPTAADGAVVPRIELATRHHAHQVAAVTADRAYYFRPGVAGRVRGLAFIPLKSVLKKLMRWYVEPLAADQRAFNAAVLTLIDELNEEASRRLRRSDDEQRHAVAVLRDEVRPLRDELGAIRAAHGRRLEELDDRLLRLERRRSTDGAATAPAAPAATPPGSGPTLDYFAFETRMRAPVEDIKSRQRRYVDDFRGVESVLDVGCGRGEFLTLLREAGIEARGVDIDADMVAFARGEGLDVEQADALEFLDAVAEGSLGGIFCAQVVEHLAPPQLIRLLELAVSRLRPGGLLIAETINPLSLYALRHFFADLSHVQPLVPDTLALLARQAGFHTAEIRFLNDPPAEERLRPVELPPEPAFDEARAALTHNVLRLNDVVFAAQDFALLARTPHADHADGA